MPRAPSWADRIGRKVIAHLQEHRNFKTVLDWRDRQERGDVWPSHNLDATSFISVQQGGAINSCRTARGGLFEADVVGTKAARIGSFDR